MPVMARELDHLVLNRGAVPGTRAFDDPGVDRRAVYVLPDDLMSLLIGIGKIAGHLLLLD